MNSIVLALQLHNNIIGDGGQRFGGEWSDLGGERSRKGARQGRNEKPGLFDRVFDLDKPFFHHWQKLLGIEKLLGFFQRAKSRPGIRTALQDARNQDDRGL